MGIIDKSNYKLSCAKCGTEETGSVLDKGSGWGGSHWQSGATFLLFDTSWAGGGKQEPKLTSAVCKECGGAAQVSSSYGGL